MTQSSTDDDTTIKKRRNHSFNKSLNPQIMQSSGTFWLTPRAARCPERRGGQAALGASAAKRFWPRPRPGWFLLPSPSVSLMGPHLLLPGSPPLTPRGSPPALLTRCLGLTSFDESRVCSQLMPSFLCLLPPPAAGVPGSLQVPRDEGVTPMGGRMD